MSTCCGGLVVSALVLAVVSIASGACTGDDSAGKNPQCTKAVYDPCRDEHDCDSALCRPITADIVVCTMMCPPGDGSTCPKFKGKAVDCNPDGLCAPPAATTCVLEGAANP